MAVRLLLLIWCLLTAVVHAAFPTQVSVKLFQAEGRIRSIQVGNFHWQQGQALRSAEHHAGGLVTVYFETGRHFSRRYEGNLLLTLNDRQQLQVLNQVPTRSYVMSVVSSENPKGWPIEALKAQAVLTQSRLLSQPNATVNDTTQDELYRGSGVIRAEVSQAVGAVWHQALFLQRRPVMPYYHASCGGHTSGPEYWHVPYVSAVVCTYCKASPFWKPTTKTIPITLWTNQLGKIPTLLTRDIAGRPLRFSNGLSGYQQWLKLGQTFGWDKAPGTNFKLVPQAEAIQIVSTGAGHGVGLCQWGAAEMARQGKSYRDILRYYFPKLTLGTY